MTAFVSAVRPIYGPQVVRGARRRESNPRKVPAVKLTPWPPLTTRPAAASAAGPSEAPDVPAVRAALLRLYDGFDLRRSRHASQALGTGDVAGEHRHPPQAACGSNCGARSNRGARRAPIRFVFSAPRLLDHDVSLNDGAGAEWCIS